MRDYVQEGELQGDESFVIKNTAKNGRRKITSGIFLASSFFDPFPKFRFFLPGQFSRFARPGTISQAI